MHRKLDTSLAPDRIRIDTLLALWQGVRVAALLLILATLLANIRI